MTGDKELKSYRVAEFQSGGVMATQRNRVRREVQKLLGIFSARWREPETCEACGERFECGATLAGCWCSEVKLSEEMRAELRKRYQRCLCRNCLERIAAER